MLPLPLLVWIVLLCQIPESQTAWQGNKRKVWRHGHGHHGPHRQPELVPDRSPFFSLLAPAKLRLGTKQNILLEAENVMEATRVDITIYDFPASSPLVQDHVILSSENNYHALKTIQIDTNALQSKEKKYVRLVAKFGRYHQEEKVMKVSFKSGYIFIQTDKPLYNPGDTVRCRAFVSNLEFQASENTISLEIQNPDGIAVHGIAKAKALDGILSQSYPLPAVLKEGKWKVVAKFDQEAENTFSREFEVKKYVLPAFNVTLILQKPHLSLQDEKLEVEVTARYLHGEPVQGLAYVLFGIEMNNEKKRISTMKQISNLNGGSVSLSLEEIKRVYPDTNALLRASIYIKASVITRSGFDIVEAEKSGIKIVRSPYVLSVRDTPRYFKPGLPFDLTVTISNHEGSPVPNVPVKVSHETLIDHHNGIIKVSINMPDDSRTQLLRVETLDTGLKPEQQAVEELRLDPYLASNSHSSNYLHISVGSNQVKVGDVLKIQALIKTSSPHHKDLVEHLNYAVLNKGKIVYAGRLNIKNLEVIVIPLLVTAEMLPAFRLVAYYMLPWQNKAEVVADSLFVDVVDRCVGSLTVGPVDGAGSNSYPPGSTFKLQIKGDAGAKVSLVAVDNAIFLLSKSRLTQKKVWEIVDQGDMGCTTGGGKDSMGVLSDAGLAFYSSRQISTIEGKGCSRHSRKRRSAARLQRKEQLEKEYTDKVLQRCCVDGMRAIPMPYSCVRRSLYITEDESCVAAFLRCCAQFRGEEIGPISWFLSTTLSPSTTSPPIKYIRENGPKIKLFSMPLARGIAPLEDAFIPSERLMLESSVVAVRQDEEEQNEEDEFDEDELDYISDIYVRAKFFESWLWTDITLPAKSSGESVYQVDTVLPDSITQWGFLAISASLQTGFCVADPYNIQAWKPFFIDLRLPHSVSRNEHVEIKAIVHNYKSAKLEVMVILEKTEDMCSVAFSAPHRQQISVQPASSTLVSYTIIPLKTGELPIQVTALAASFMGQDAVRKNLHVVVEGVQIIKVRSFVLDPVEKGDSDGRQQVTVDEMQMVGVVPKSLPETFINVRGDLLADSIDNSINEDALAALIRMPGGCVEQNLASMTLPLIAAHYLDRSQRWDSVGVHRRDEAIKYIQRGYTNQLNYRKRDGSYPPYRNEGASTWITAYVVKVFSMARSFIDVSEGHLCDPLLFILKNKQRPDGSFQEDNPVYTTSMTGGLHGSESQVSLSAFVLVALAEAQNSIRCSDPGFSVEDKHRKATEYLQEQYPRLKRPYSAALACYALALSSGGCTKSTILSFASPDGSHWPEPGYHFFTLEATGYALLALVKGGHMDEAAKPFRWLNEQRGVGGGYGSTQSTMVVLQALSEYLVKKSSPTDLNLLVELSVSGRRDVRWTFNPKISSAARTSSVPLDQNFTVVASGNGKGILEVVTVYHQLPDVYVNSTCNGFQLDVSITGASETPPPDVEKSYRLIINVRALEEHQAKMVILDIGLPTGFEPENSDLELLSNSVDRYINNFQVVDNLSDRGSLIIHLFKVSSGDTDMISFRLHQKFKVGLLQPSIVTAYQYYNKDRRCSRFYSPLDDKEQLDQICKDDVCRCAHGDCCVMKADSSFFDAELRKASVCSGLHHAYKAKLTSISLSHIDQYEMEIVQMIKEGLEEGLREKDKRSFLSHASCRSGLPFREGQEYLIIGPIKDVWQAGRMSADRLVYILGKDTWVERWPTTDECRDDATLRAKCAGLESFANALTLSGCHT